MIPRADVCRARCSTPRDPRQGAGAIDEDEWYFLLTGGVSQDLAAVNPCAGWLRDKQWAEVAQLSGLPAFKGLAASFDEEVRASQIARASSALCRTMQD